MKIENNLDLLAAQQQELQAKRNRELKYIGSIKHQKGHTLFEVNLNTGAIKKADIQKTASVGLNSKVAYTSKVTVSKDCYYLEALNIKNAQKKFLKLINYEHRA